MCECFSIYEFKIFEFILCFRSPIWFLSTPIVIWNLPCQTNDTGHWEPKRLKKNLESLCKQMLHCVIITTVLSEMRKWGSERLSPGPKAAWVPRPGGAVRPGRLVVSPVRGVPCLSCLVHGNALETLCSNHQALCKGHASFFREGLNSSSSETAMLLSRDGFKSLS